MRRLRFSERIAKDMIEDISDGLECLVRNKIGHGNLKPENILISEGKYKITDYGLTIVLEVEMHMASSLIGLEGETVVQ